MQAQGKKAKASVPTTDAQPSVSHMSIATLVEASFCKYVVTTNLDGLFRKAGLKGIIGCFSFLKLHRSPQASL
jgi:NAD-dependent SIR2 family protein deacetylase